MRPVLPSSFVRGWERASGPDLYSEGDYSYLYKYIKGGKEKLDGTAQTLAGVKADDAAMTLEVTLSAPYANFPAVAGFQTFYPMPKATEALADQKDWEKGIMIGNGPYKLEKPRNDQEIVVVRNDKWAGDIFGNKRAKLDKITFKISQDVESAYNSFEAGEGDTATIPPGRYKEARDNYGTTIRHRDRRLLLLQLRHERPGGRRGGQQVAPAGHLAGHRSGADQRCRLRRDS